MDDSSDNEFNVEDSGATGGNDNSEWLFEGANHGPNHSNIKPYDDDEDDLENYYEDFEHYSSDTDSLYGAHDLIEESILSEDFGDDEFYLLRTSKDDERCDDLTYRRLQRSDRILNGFSEDQKTGQFCDVILEIDGQEFPIHKGVFKNCSTYFSAMFTGNFNESSREKISIPNVSKEEFQVILDFTYGRPTALNLDTIFGVFMTAEMMCMDELIKECRVRLEEIFIPDNLFSSEEEVEKSIEHCTKIMILGEKMGMKEFGSKVIASVKHEIKYATNKSQIMLKLPPPLMLPLLELSTKWNSFKESGKVNFLCRWLDFDPEDRLLHWERILDSVNFELLQLELVEVLKAKLGLLLSKYLGPQVREEFNAKFQRVAQQPEPKNFVVEVSLFSQNPDTKRGDFRIFRENENGNGGTWVYKSLKLQCEIVQSVKVNNQLVLFGRDSYYFIPLADIDGPLERRKAHVLKQFSHFAACTQKTQIIIAGMSSTEDNENDFNSITILTIHYWKAKPEIRKLFYFRCDSHKFIRPMAVSCADSIFFVHATNPAGSEWGGGVLLVNANRKNVTIQVSALDPMKLNKGKYCFNRLFMHLNGQTVYLIDQRHSLFSGLRVTLPNFFEEKPTKKIITVTLPSCCARIYPEDNGFSSADGFACSNDEKNDQNWAGAIPGTLVDNCKVADGHVLLVAQGNNLVLFSMESLREFQFLKVLPSFDRYLSNLDLPNTNFFLRIFSN